MGQIFGFDLLACTITQSARGEGRYVRAATSSGAYGHVILTIEPYRGRRHFLLDWAVDEDTIPSEFRAGVIEGIQSVAIQGVPEMGPFVHIKVTVTGGSYHEVDSRSVDFKVAAAIAFKNALALTQITSVGVTKRDIRYWDEADAIESE